jgi:hypothetical protein
MKRAKLRVHLVLVKPFNELEFCMPKAVKNFSIKMMLFLAMNGRLN